MTVLWATAVRRRPVIFVLLLLVSAVAVALSSSGPLLIRAVEQSSTATAIADADPADRSVVVSAVLPKDTARESFATTARSIVYLGPGTGTDGQTSNWSAPSVSFASTTNEVWRVGTGPQVTSRYVVADPDCSGLVLTAGRCPVRSGEVALATGDLAGNDGKLGEAIRITRLSGGDLKLTVVGSYSPDRSTSVPLVRPGTTSGSLAGVDGEPLVVSAVEDQLVADLKVYAQIELRSDLGWDAVASTRSGIDEIQSSVLAHSEAVFGLSTGVPALLDRLENQWDAARVLILVCALQGTALAIFTLIIMAQQLARVRSAEWSIGRLQGVRRSTRWGAVYAETVIPLLLGIPLGLLAAWLGVAALIRAELRPGTPAELGRTPVLVAAGATGAVAILAVIAISIPTLRRPLAELVLQRTEPRRLTVFAAVVQAMVVVLALTTGYQLVIGGVLDAAGTPLGLIAPSLFALAAALIIVRLATAAARWGTRRRPRYVLGLTVGRRIARTPSALNPSLVVAVALALTVLSSQVLLLSLRNQDLRADATNGAETVLHVTGAASADALIAAVDRADPNGRWAAAVQETAESSDGGTSRIVAVDTTRFAAVTRWKPAWAEIADIGVLRGQVAPTLTLRGTTVTVDLIDVSVSPQEDPLSGGRPVQPQPGLQLVVQAGDTWQNVALGTVKKTADRTLRLTAALPQACAGGCRVIAFSIANADQSGYQASFTLSGLATDGLPRATTDGWLRRSDQWQPSSAVLEPDATGTLLARATEAGLSLSANDIITGSVQVLRSRDATDPLPALVAPAVDAQPVPGSPQVASGTGLDGQRQLITVVGRASVLPRSLGDGVLVDLHTVASLSNPGDSEATSEVWLATGAPASVVDGLTRAGLKIAQRDELSTVRARLRGLPMTRAAAVAAGVGTAAQLLALLALLAGRAVDAEQRRADWAALRRAGLRPGRIRAVAMIEIAAPGIAGVLLGTASGLAATVLTAPQLPVVDLTSAGPPLDLAVAVTPVLTTAAVAVGVIIVVGAIGAALETREVRR